MLKLQVDETTLWNEKEEQFIEIPKTTLQLEHSLVSLSKWESKWHKAFLQTQLTTEETLDYVKCMIMNNNVDPNVVYGLSDENILEIKDYISNPMTATWFTDNNKKESSEVVTSEIIYYWMISLQIPFECQKWHLNRLLTLIRVCNEKNAPKKNMSKREIAERNRILNEQRKARYKSRG
jgi:hypothetical protein